MKKIMTVFCYTDIHNQSSMLDMPTSLRTSLITAAGDSVKEFGKSDLTIVGGDNISDYPFWDRSAWLPKKNFLDIKEKLVRCIADTANGEKALYVAGNNDMILGDIGKDGQKPYNTTDFYHSGPMKETLGELPENEHYSVTAKEKPWEPPYLDAFHYTVNGIDFIGINIDPDTAFNTHDGYYTDETIEWLKAKLAEIDPSGTKPVFVIGHLSAQCYMNGNTWTESMEDERAAKLYDAFSGHKNLFYLYGHVHGENYLHKEYSSGAVLHIGADMRAIDANLSNTDSSAYKDYAFSLVHMGGLRPFRDENFESDGRTGFGGEETEHYFIPTGTPKLAQYLVFEVYEDRVVFYMRNAGNKEGYTRNDKLLPYTVFLQK